MNGQLDTFCAKVLLISAVFMACTTRLNSSMQCFSLRVPYAEISSEVWLFEAFHSSGDVVNFAELLATDVNHTGASIQWF